MRDLYALLIVGAVGGLLYYVYLFYWNYIVIAGLAALAVLAVFALLRLARRYGPLLWGGVPFHMTGQNIIDYANKYFDDGYLTYAQALYDQRDDKTFEKFVSNMEKHMEFIRDAMFNPANPAYSPVDLGKLPSPVRKALLPDLLGFYGKGWRFKCDLRNSGIKTFHLDALTWAYRAIGQAPSLDKWHHRRLDIVGLMGPVRYDVSKEGTTVYVFDIDSEWTSPYDEELKENGLKWGNNGTLDTDNGSWADRAEELFHQPPLEEFIAPPAKLLFREVSSEEGGHLHKGHIFLGTNIRDGKPYWKPLQSFQHHLVVGISGYGKSVLLNMVLQGIRYNIEHYEHVYLIDLKGGVELIEYQDYGEEFKVLYKYDDLHPVVSGLVLMMEQRLEWMRENRVRKWTGKRILVVVDEYAQIALYIAETKEEKLAHAKLLANLNKLSMLGRAVGVFLWVQLQKSTTDVMDSSFKGNLQGQIAFRLPSRLAAAGLFGEAKDLEIDPTRLRAGQFIYYDDAAGETVYLQSHMRIEGV